MKYRKVGKSGLKVSEVSLGSWMTYGDELSDDDSMKCLRAGLEHDINYFDTADAYANGTAEVMIGEFLKEIDRKDVVISSKLFWPMSENPNDSGLGRKHIRESIDLTLERLGTIVVVAFHAVRVERGTVRAEGRRRRGVVSGRLRVVVRLRESGGLRGAIRLRVALRLRRGVTGEADASRSRRAVVGVG